MAKQLSREEWAEINYLEAQIQEIFVKSALIKKQILIAGEGFDIPKACFPGEDGYNEIQYLKAKIKALKDPRSGVATPKTKTVKLNVLTELGIIL